MDSNEGRRSKVPAGTFRSSSHPPPADDESGAESPARLATQATSGQPPAASGGPPKPPAPPMPSSAPTRRVAAGAPSGGPPKLAPPTPIDGGRAKFTSTLVGVRSVPPPVPSGPVLAPPPWRGASAYQSGEEPQPRVSSISSPGVLDGAISHPDSRRVPHTRITAAAPPAPAADAPSTGEPASAATAAISDAIQQLLDSQASVPMEVEEAAAQQALTAPVASNELAGLTEHEALEALRDGALEPVRESSIEVLRDSAIEEVSPLPPVRSLPPAAPVARSASAEPAARTRVEPTAVPEPKSTAAHHARWSAPPAPVVSPKLEAPALSDRELAAYSFVEPVAAAVHGGGGPAEPARAPANDSYPANLRLGAIVAVLIAVVGVGGFLLTRGGFKVPPRAPKPAAAPAAPLAPTELPDPALPAAPAALGETPAQAALETIAPAAQEQGDLALPSQAPPAPAPAPAVPRAASPRASAGPATAAARPATRPNEAVAEAAVPPEATAQEQGVLKVSPQQEALPGALPAVLPETPTRENVQAALDQKRSEVLACAAGQRGIAEVDLTVSSSGAVTHVVVAGDFAGTPAGSCIARVLRTATFAPFSKPRFRVIYPFSL